MINHLWQSTIFAIAIGLLALALRKNRASLRHWLWFTASIKFLLPLSFLMSLGQQAQPTTPRLARPVAVAVLQVATPFPEAIQFTAAAHPEKIDWTPWILAAWALGFLTIAFVRFRGWLHIRALIRTSTPTSLSLPVEARYTTGRLGPGIAGIGKPVLLLPAGIEQRLTPEQFDTAIAHELCHVRRRDNLFAAIHMFVEAVFWFHPLVWWIGTRLVEERELACDEAVIAQGGSPRDYAEAILGICKHYVEAPVACVSGVTGADIKKRLEAILSPRQTLGLALIQKLLLVTAALVVAIVPFVAGIATAQSRSFEVASIRPVDPSTEGRGNERALRPELNSARYADAREVYNFITKAFGLEFCPIDLMAGEDCPYVTGGPAWIRKDRYEIRATLPEGTPPTEAAIAPMLEALLRDRFQLKFHHEMREAPVFLLTVAKGGPKVRLAPKDGPMFQAKDGTMRRVGRFTGGSKVGPNGQMLSIWTVRNYSMPDAARTLALVLNRPVLDRTGLAGNFDWDLEYGADPDADPNSRVGPYRTGPEIFSAIQEQAGLRLQATKEKVDIIVIDSIERPSEN